MNKYANMYSYTYLGVKLSLSSFEQWCIMNNFNKHVEFMNCITTKNNRCYHDSNYDKIESIKNDDTLYYNICILNIVNATSKTEIDCVNGNFCDIGKLNEYYNIAYEKFKCLSADLFEIQIYTNVSTT